MFLNVCDVDQAILSSSRFLPHNLAQPRLLFPSPQSFRKNARLHNPFPPTYLACLLSQLASRSCIARDRSQPVSRWSHDTNAAFPFPSRARSSLTAFVDSPFTTPAQHSHMYNFIPSAKLYTDLLNLQLSLLPSPRSLPEARLPPLQKPTTSYPHDSIDTSREVLNDPLLPIRSPQNGREREVFHDMHPRPQPLADVMRPRRRRETTQKLRRHYPGSPNFLYSKISPNTSIRR